MSFAPGTHMTATGIPAHRLAMAATTGRVVFVVRIDTLHGGPRAEPREIAIRSKMQIYIHALTYCSLNNVAITTLVLFITLIIPYTSYTT